jgi:transposase
MSKMAELDLYTYDIEQLYIEGITEKNIAKTLDIPVEYVYAWMQLNGITSETDPWAVMEDPHAVN